MEKVTYIAPEADFALLSAEDVVLISVVDNDEPEPLPEIKW